MAKAIRFKFDATLLVNEHDRKKLAAEHPGLSFDEALAKDVESLRDEMKNGLVPGATVNFFEIEIIEL